MAMMIFFLVLELGFASCFGKSIKLLSTYETKNI
jgi:hypothetical protein